MNFGSPAAIMSIRDTLVRLEPLLEELDAHPVYRAVRTLGDARVFMAHHVYAVWDFMSLLKGLQAALAPARHPWAPTANAASRRFINEIVLEEESDLGPPVADGARTYASHFELYGEAMREIGADPEPAHRFAEHAARHGFASALAVFPDVPPPARQFMQTTFAFLATRKPHVVAAAFAFGREQVIPAMFRALLARMGVKQRRAPVFHYYLERHIHLDEGQHGPLALRMLEELIGDDATRRRETELAAVKAIRARIDLWDGVREAIAAAHRDRRLAS